MSARMPAHVHAPAAHHRRVWCTVPRKEEVVIKVGGFLVLFLSTRKLIDLQREIRSSQKFKLQYQHVLLQCLPCCGRGCVLTEGHSGWLPEAAKCVNFRGELRSWDGNWIASAECDFCGFCVFRVGWWW